jgi:hypothetical protein
MAREQRAPRSASGPAWGSLRAGSALALVLSPLIAILVWNGERSEHPRLNHDVANALFVGRRLLEGERLYVDWSYFVLPPVVLLSAGVCALARVLPLTAPTLVQLLVVATAALGAVVLHRTRPDSPAAAGVALLAYLGVLAHVGGYPGDFGQREHLFVLLFVPYFLWRVSGAPVSVPVVALLVALGFAATIKPHFVLAVALTELFQVGARRPRAVVWGPLLAGAVLPFLLLGLHSRESLEALWTRVLPYHASRADAPYNVPWRPFLTSRRHLALLGLAAVSLAAVALARSRRAIPLRTAGAVAAVLLALYGSFLQQRKFFTYHELPFVGFAWVLAAGLGFELARALPRRTPARLACAAIVLVAVGLFVRGSVSLARRAAAGPSPHFRPLLPLLEGRALVLVLSPSVEGEIFTYTFRHDLELMGPWTSHYTLPALLAAAGPAREGEVVSAYFAPLAASIEARRPDLVLFSPFRQGIPGRRTLYELLVLEHRVFPTLGYRFATRTGNGWIVYERADARR